MANTNGKTKEIHAPYSVDDYPLHCTYNPEFKGAHEDCRCFCHSPEVTKPLGRDPTQRELRDRTVIALMCRCFFAAGHYSLKEGA